MGNDDTDQLAKDRFFPAIEKRTLFSQGYISRRSSHSTGLAVDFAIEGLNFGTTFDFFDPRSSTNSQLVTEAAAANRRRGQRLIGLYPTDISSPSRMFVVRSPTATRPMSDESSIAEITFGIYNSKLGIENSRKLRNSWNSWTLAKFSQSATFSPTNS